MVKSKRRPTLLRVRKRPGFKSQGVLTVGRRAFPCALGRSGIGRKLREGDGLTPLGRFALLEKWVRPDRPTPGVGRAGARLISRQDGWCDAPGDRNYNRHVRLPYPASHETLWRKDRLYDVMIVLDHNRTRYLRRGGSAIFFHLAHEDLRPTEGCIALRRADMRQVLSAAGRKAHMVVG